MKPLVKGNDIEAWRIARGYTIHQMAMILDYNPRTLAKVEYGTLPVSLALIDNIHQVDHLLQQGAPRNRLSKPLWVDNGWEPLWVWTVRRWLRVHKMTLQGMAAMTGRSVKSLAYDYQSLMPPKIKLQQELGHLTKHWTPLSVTRQERQACLTYDNVRERDGY